MGKLGKEERAILLMLFTEPRPGEPLDVFIKRAERMARARSEKRQGEGVRA